jgi:hypothetical protein
VEISEDAFTTALLSALDVEDPYDDVEQEVPTNSTSVSFSKTARLRWILGSFTAR